MNFFEENNKHTSAGILLEKFNLYYRNLNPEAKKKFVSRVFKIDREIKVLGRGIEVTDDMRYILLSYIAQLTFGLKGFFLTGYEYIYVYPEAFTLRDSNNINEGVTYTNKIIAVSWKKFSEGHLLANDGENIFFYQLGMALVQTVNNGVYFDQHFGSYIDTWYEIYLTESKLNPNTNKYVGTSQEFDYIFSRLLEAFFEKPLELKQAFPNSFAHLCLLLNQNPLNAHNDYLFENSFFKDDNLTTPLPKQVKKIYKYNRTHWSYKLPIFTFAMGFFFYLHLLEKVVINISEAVIIVFVLSVATIGLTYRFIKPKMIYHNIFEYWLICLFGFVPIGFFSLIVLSLYINFNPQTTYHAIDQIEINETYNRKRGTTIKSFTFYFKDKFLNDYPYARTIDIRDNNGYQNIISPSTMKLTISKGIAGFDIIQNKEVIIDEHTGY
ncbi:MAG: zinc-dependent peptidase [Bacteroidota bacterium]